MQFDSKRANSGIDMTQKSDMYYKNVIRNRLATARKTMIGDRAITKSRSDTQINQQL